MGTLRKQHSFLHNNKSDHIHDVEQFAHDLKVLHKIIGMSDEQILEHFKEAFPTKIEA